MDEKSQVEGAAEAIASAGHMDAQGKEKVLLSLREDSLPIAKRQISNAIRECELGEKPESVIASIFRDKATGDIRLAVTRYTQDGLHTPVIIDPTSGDPVDRRIVNMVEQQLRLLYGRKDLGSALRTSSDRDNSSEYTVSTTVIGAKCMPKSPGG